MDAKRRAGRMPGAAEGRGFGADPGQSAPQLEFTCSICRSKPPTIGVDGEGLRLAWYDLGVRSEERGDETGSCRGDAFCGMG